jgi:MFS family permease
MVRGLHAPQGSSLGRNGDFVRLWSGGAVSGLGSSIAALAYPLLALSVTSSAGRAGLLGLVALGAGALMRLPAGALVDRMPLRRVLVVADVVRVVTTAALLTSVVTGHLALWQLLVVAAINAFAAVFSEIAHSVALRHVVAPDQLPTAFALNDGRGHAISLAGQPAGGYLYGVAPSLPLVADLISFVTSAVVSATIKPPMRPATEHLDHSRLRTDLLTGLTFLWREPFLRATLLAASGYQLVFAGATFVLIASFTAAGVTPAGLGLLFAVAAVGGILGAIAAPVLQSRLQISTVVVLMGWGAAAVFATFAWIDQPLLAGALLGCIFFLSAPANAMLLAAQITRTPSHLQGRVMAASYLIAGLAAPLGPPISGALLDATGRSATFLAIAAVTGIITITVHLSRPMRAQPRPSGSGEA